MRTPIFLLLALVFAANIYAQTEPPTDTARLVFIHHSVGEDWLNIGGLREVLNANNYYVTDTDSEWGPDNIGSYTDIGHWHNWFLGPDRDTYMEALYRNEHLSGGIGPNIMPAPPGPNSVVMFKSCYPNSSPTSGDPDDPPLPIGQNNPIWGASIDLDRYYSVSNIKGLYRDLLAYFATQQDKLFVLITTPPLVEEYNDPDSAARHRGITLWLVNDWLDDYPHQNVFVFDYYNILTSNGGDVNTNDLGATTGNHHRLGARGIEHVVGMDNNYLAYGFRGDSHPTTAGHQKATTEFIPLLNIAYNLWRGVSEPDGPGPDPEPTTAGIIAKVEEMLDTVHNYRLRVVRNDGSGYVSNAEIDLEEKAMHSLVQIGLGSPREVEYYWIGENAYGMPRHSGTWFPVAVPNEPSNRLRGIFSMLKTGEVVLAGEREFEEEICWVLAVTPDLYGLRSNAEERSNDLFPGYREGSEKDRELVDRVEEAMREAEAQAEIWISQKTLYIKQAFLRTLVFGDETQTSYYIHAVNDPSLHISPPGEALAAEGRPMPLGFLFVQLPNFK